MIALTFIIKYKYSNFLPDISPSATLSSPRHIRLNHSDPGEFSRWRSKKFTKIQIALSPLLMGNSAVSLTAKFNP
ncbi:Uncharacterised protein [Enterobacter cloacae]|uniref:Uncharacterized protein n=1 Tax=Enterobacter cloacae TaxID=550 RepID=A0A377LTN6_ENTCL|nr:Uncharacterised protein [Enterobacter cloacae]